MTHHEHDTVVGVFRDTGHARQAIESLKDAGFDSSDISILMHDSDQARGVAEDTGADVATGATTGAIGGGILGGLAGWLVGVGALAIPGVGPFIAAGAFGTALAGAGIGAGVGAIAGALVGMGVPKDEAEYYETEVRGGNALVTVKSGGRYSEARDIMFRHGAYDVHDRGETTSTTTGYTGTMTGTTGRAGDIGGTTASGTYADTGYTGTGRWEDTSSHYRDRFQQRYGTMGSGYRWEDYEPGYRYGWEMGNRPEHRGRDWSEMEPEFRRDWERRHHDKPWDRFMDSIREAWDDTTGKGTRRAA